MELSALRILGLGLAACLIAFAVWRRQTLRNGDILLLFAAAVALLLVSATDVLDAVLSFFSFERGGGGRILGLAVFAIVVLFMLTLRGLVQNGRIERKLSATLEGIAWEEFRADGLPARFKDKVAVVIPAYNEEDNIGSVLPRIPATVCGVETAVLVVDDGSRDRTGDVAREHGAAVARHVTNLGGGAALRTGYRMMSDSRRASSSRSTRTASTCPRRCRGSCSPCSTARSTSPTARACSATPRPTTSPARWGSSSSTGSCRFITRTKVTDCSNGYRAVRSTVLPTLVLRQEQFHTSEFMIEAIKRGVPAKEVAVTVVCRLHGHSKKPAVIRYGIGFTNAIMRTWLR